MPNIGYKQFAFLWTQNKLTSVANTNQNVQFRGLILLMQINLLDLAIVQIGSKL